MKYGGTPSALANAEPLAENKIFVPGHRYRLNIVAICLNLFVPWIVFSALFCCVSFGFHFESPVKTWMLVAAAYVAAAITGCFAYRAKKRDRHPLWLSFSTFALSLATTAAAIFGDMNYHYNMDPYYTVIHLNSYPSLDPSAVNGQEIMDAGRVYFTDGTGLDTKKAMSFQQDDLYCVVPIVNGEKPTGHYDIWAIGINCCSGVSSDFRCGEFNNPHARSGLRLVRDDYRAYFRLAVQQAEAAYNIRSPHPLFFYWMQDPVKEIESWRDDGWRYYLLGVFSHLAFNSFCILTAIVGFSRIGTSSI